MAYAVSFKTSAVKQVKKLPKSLAQRILAKAAALGQEPRPPGSIKLSGASNLWRLRVGDYRIVYHIDDAKKLVDVRIIAHRREVYRDI
jgi:mRNA interferase RelE/StbE